MRDHEESEGGAAEQRFQPLDGVQVEVIRRLIEGEKAGAEGEAARQGRFAHHAAREGGHGRVGIVETQLLAVGAVGKGDRLRLFGAADLQEAPHRHLRGEYGPLLHARHGERPVPGNAAVVGLKLAVEEPQECRFARPVPADKADLLPRVDADGDMLEQGRITQGDAHVGEGEDVHAVDQSRFM